MALTANAQIVMTNLNNTASKVAGVMTYQALLDGISIATTAASQASSVGATLESQLFNTVVQELTQTKTALEALYQTLDSHADVFAEVNNIT